LGRTSDKDNDAESRAVLSSRLTPRNAGQVHHGTARGGRDLAIKVQYPGIR
jgi:hypothetical protein